MVHSMLRIVDIFLNFCYIGIMMYTSIKIRYYYRYEYVLLKKSWKSKNDQ